MSDNDILKGFLNEETMNVYREKFVNENEKEFDFAKRLNNYMYSVYGLIADLSKPKERITDYIVANYVLMHKSYQSILILLQMGLSNDARIILRTILEKLIYIKCVEENEVYFDILCVHALLDRKNIYRMIEEKILDNENINIADSESNDNCIITNMLKQISQTLGKNYNFKTIKNDFKIHNFAEIAKMREEYKKMYNVLSKNIHSNMNALQREFLTDSGFEYDLNPTNENATLYIQSVVDLLIRATEILLNHYKLNTLDLKKLYEEEKALWG